MKRLTVFAGLLCLCATAQAAIVVVSEDAGRTSRQYFDNGTFVMTEGGRPAFGADSTGTCWFVQQEKLVSDPCEKMLDSMASMRDRAMAGLSAQERAMMEQMMSMQRPSAVEVRPAPAREIAGYNASCHRVGETREVCVSDRLLDEIKSEMGNSRFIEMTQRFQEQAAKMSVDDPASGSVRALLENGYPMYDMQRSSAMPGMEAAMMKLLPETQRAQIMQQIQAAGVSGQTQGSRVIHVDKNATMPQLDASRYQRVSFEQFMNDAMANMPGMKR